MKETKDRPNKITPNDTSHHHNINSQLQAFYIVREME